MLINQHTKIAVLLKQHPRALDTIAALNPKFEKLRNPLLRKLMAGRVSIGMAAKIGGCEEENFYSALRPLGFIPEEEIWIKDTAGNEAPPQQHPLKEEQVVTLDVRPILEAGTDPLKQILASIRTLKQGEGLKIINTFEPTPLIAMLEKKGFSSFTTSLGPQHIETLFFREEALDPEEEVSPQDDHSEGWEEVTARFAGHLQELDVRALEMPQPMMRILTSLDALPEGTALLVHHKRIPLFLLPELAQLGFEYRSRQITENEVDLIIFRN